MLSKSGTFSSLSHDSFRLIIISCFLIVAARIIEEVALSYWLYIVTKNSLAIGGLVFFSAVPSLLALFFSGHIADKLDRKKIIIFCLMTISVSSILFGLICSDILIFNDNFHTKIKLIYLVAFLRGLAISFMTPALFAFRSESVPSAKLHNAASWVGISDQIACLLGAAIGGFLYALVGASHSFFLCALITGLAAAVIALLSAPPRAARAHEGFFTSLQAAYKFVAEEKAIMVLLLLDAVVMLFGNILILLPIVVIDIFKQGPEQVGLLRSVCSLGAIITLVVSTRGVFSKIGWHSIVYSHVGFSLCVLFLSLQKTPDMYFFLLFLIGSFDSIGTLMRVSVISKLTPTHFLGRVGSFSDLTFMISSKVGEIRCTTFITFLSLPATLFVSGAASLFFVIFIVALSKSQRLAVKLNKALN